MRQENHALAYMVGAVAVLFILFVAAGSVSGIFAGAKSDADAKVIVAGLTLIGSFLAAVVTLVAAFLKHSFDLRTERRLTLESERNAALEREAEARLKLDVAIRAVQLLGTSAGTPSPPMQRAGALFALVSLGQFELTVAIVDNLLAHDQIDASTATAILETVFARGGQRHQEAAITTLSNNTQKLVSDMGVCFPAELLPPKPTAYSYIREWTPIILGRLLLERPRAWWIEKGETTNMIIFALAQAYQNEPEPRLKTGTGAILKAVLNALPSPELLFDGDVELNVGELRNRVATVAATTTATADIERRLGSWHEAG